MAYNGKELEAFVQTVISQANAAAQEVFDRNQIEFERRIINQLKPGDKLCCGMGMASIVTAKGESLYENSLARLLTQLQYPYQELNASFATPDIKKG